MQTRSYNWSSRPRFIPASSRRYQIVSPNRVLIIGASKARKARLTKTVTAATAITAQTIPVENIAAIRLLDTWLSRAETDSGDRAEGMRQRIDENRLSDRKFFT